MRLVVTSVAHADRIRAEGAVRCCVGVVGITGARFCDDNGVVGDCEVALACVGVHHSGVVM